MSRKASSTDRGTESMHHAVTPSPPATISLKAGPALGLIYDMLAEMCHDLERWFGTVETAASEDPDFLQLVARATLFLEENGGEVPDKVFELFGRPRSDSVSVTARVTPNGSY